MSVNWPVGKGAQIVGGDIVSMVINGRCEEGMIYLTFYSERLGYSGQGTVVNPVIPAPVTTFVLPWGSPYELSFDMAGSGGTATIPASERNGELGGTLNWTLESNLGE